MAQAKKATQAAKKVSMSAKPALKAEQANRRKEFFSQKAENAKTANKKEKTAKSKTSKSNDFFDASKKMQDSMKNSNPFLKGAEEMFNKFTPKGDMPKMDQEKMLDMHKKNMETLTEANKLAVDVMRQIAQLQGQFLTQTFTEVDQLVRENLAFKNAKPEECVKKNTERFKGAVERAMEHSNNVSQVMLKSNQDIFKTVQNRFEEGMKEMQANFNKTKH
jgi:phasin family protein